MTRNLKALGLALIAVFAMSAIAASAAQAEAQFTASAYPAVGHATTEQKIGEEKEYFEAVGRKLECEVAHFSATLAGPNKDLSVTPDYTDHTQGGNCKAGGTLVTTVTENNCVFTFTVTGTETANVNYALGVDIVCPSTTLTVHVRNVVNNANACTITIEDEAVTGDLTGTNNGNHVDISGTVGVHSIVHSTNTVLCGVEAGTSKTVTTNYVIKKAVTFTSTGKTVSISD